MKMVIVPRHVDEAIHAALDVAIDECPDAEDSRPHLYQQLLAYYHEHGEIPEFSLKKTEGEL